MTLGRLSSGSPMPMNTTWLMRRSVSFWSVRYWPTISPADRLRSKPPRPVAQNLQPMGQPTWLEMQQETRSW